MIVTFTWRGDANLDGVVNGSDYALTDTGFSGNENHWYYGDYNFDMIVGGSDYALIDTGFTSQAAASIGMYIPVATSVRATKLNGVTARLQWQNPSGNVQKVLIWMSVDDGDFKLAHEALPNAQNVLPTSWDFNTTVAGQHRYKISIVSNYVVSRAADALDPTTLDEAAIDLDGVFSLQGAATLQHYD